MRPLYLRAWCTMTSLKGAECHFHDFFHQQTMCFPLQNKSYLVPVQLWKVGFLYWTRLQLINQSKREKENTKCIRTKCELQTWSQKNVCNMNENRMQSFTKLLCWLKFMLCCSNIPLQSYVKQTGEPCPNFSWEWLSFRMTELSLGIRIPIQHLYTQYTAISQ